MKICFIFGTRPEIIKISELINVCELKKINYILIHTNQHYTEKLDKVFFNCLSLPKPKYNLHVGSGTHGEVTGKIIERVEKILIKENPDVVLVQGDTNSVLGGALASSKLDIPIGHIEAGLRSYDKKMPEEINRIIVDHISDFLFVPTPKAFQNLLKEGVNKKKIFIVGNTIVDALLKNKKIAENKSKILDKLNVKSKQYVLCTIHRQENVLNKQRLKNIFEGIKKISCELTSSIIIPAHPRLVTCINKYNINLNDKIKIIDPLDYLDFIKLQNNAKLIITDSGGVQEESCILKVPCITTRDNTERPETLNVKSNFLVGDDIEKIFKYGKKMINSRKNWKNPFGDGKSSLKIIKILNK